ncbi:DUF664 domain-containing protein [Umezawaea sp. Da 62-37]|uniref:mycothiol transferase n=1 Tax=Umezawaea sp. Da 62-37 TaxID=3075927 RepID=UPI0028F6ED68|nr:DUF664 domain-containing protein [Umezawaea sp. Da 62-37]WNV88275.1 DUF664 domain-containing protein [Umezawaea sp. Da 62-37]
MTETPLVDTTIHEPSPTAGETEMMLFALERVRGQFAWKCGGLDTAGLDMRHPPSTMTLGGLLKHMALLENGFIARDLSGEPIGPPWDAVDFDAEPGWEWRSAAGDSPEELYALWSRSVERSRAAWATALADGGLDRPSRFALPSGEHLNLRRVLIDLIEEYLRHTGHADLLREAFDGLVGNDPPQAR